MQPVFVPAGQVLSEATVVFAYDDDFHFGVLTSGFHYRWAVRYASSLETRVRYTPSDVFETFPQPPYSDAVASAGGELDAHRSRLMQDRDLGLTSIFNLVHDQANARSGLVDVLRSGLVALLNGRAVIEAPEASGSSGLFDWIAGWSDLPQARRL